MDDYNVNITLPSYLSKFVTTLGRLCIYPEHVFNGDVTTVETSDAAMQGIGNGPFKLKEWNKGENIIYEKNTDYYRGEAKIDELIMKIIPDSSAKEVAFQSGEVSCLRISSKEKYEKYSADENYEIYDTPECRVNYFTCNPMSSKITSKEAREAIFYAINLDEIMDTVYGSDIMSQPGKTVFCDQNLYFAKEMENYPYDLEKAKELAKESRPGSGNSEIYLQQSASWYARSSNCYSAAAESSRYQCRASGYGFPILLLHVLPVDKR